MYDFPYNVTVSNGSVPNVTEYFVTVFRINDHTAVKG